MLTKWRQPPLNHRRFSARKLMGGFFATSWKQTSMAASKSNWITTPTVYGPLGNFKRYVLSHRKASFTTAKITTDGNRLFKRIKLIHFMQRQLMSARTPRTDWNQNQLGKLLLYSHLCILDRGILDIGVFKHGVLGWGFGDAREPYLSALATAGSQDLLSCVQFLRQAAPRRFAQEQNQQIASIVWLHHSSASRCGGFTYMYPAMTACFVFYMLPAAFDLLTQEKRSFLNQQHFVGLSGTCGFVARRKDECSPGRTSGADK